MNNSKNCNAQNESKSVSTEVLQSSSPKRFRKHSFFLKKYNFLHRLHNNYSNVNISLHVAQISNRFTKLNILHENHFRYGIQGHQISNKNKIRTFSGFFSLYDSFKHLRVSVLHQYLMAFFNL